MTDELERAVDRCRLCRRKRRPLEPDVCDKCVQTVRDDLTEILDSFPDLPGVAEGSALRNTYMPGGDALVLMADGSVDGGGPDDDISFNDPIAVIGQLESDMRAWRAAFSHGPAPDIATVENCTKYLLTHLLRASQHYEEFDDFTASTRNLKLSLTRTLGTSNAPKRAAVACFECGGELIKPYRPPLPVTTRRFGYDFEGLEDSWSCQSCEGIYDEASYYLAMRAKLESQAEKAG